MSDKPAFPLDAEQILRGAAFVLAQIVNANCHPSEMVSYARLTLRLADAMGVPVSVETDQHGDRLLLDYGEPSRFRERLSLEEKRARAHQAAGSTPSSSSTTKPGLGEADV